MRFLEVYLKENNIKVPTQILELYNYLKSEKSEMVDPRTVDIVTETFFHFTKSHKENFNDLKFNKKSFYQDFGLPENYIFDDGVLYAYSLHDLTEKRKTITIKGT